MAGDVDEQSAANEGSSEKIMVQAWGKKVPNPIRQHWIICHRT